MNEKIISQNPWPVATLPCRPARAAVSPLSAAAKIVTGPAKLMIKTLMAITVMAGLTASASAQVIGYFADPYITVYGGASGANGNHLNIGNTFNVTGAGITVYQLGAFDWQGDGLASSHIVTLFSNQTAIASVTVPAGTAAPLNDGFRFEPLAAPVFLAAGQYAVVAYQMNASDPYGDYNNGIPSDFNTGASVTRGGGIFDFVTSTTAYPTQNGGSYNFISASFTYIDSTAVWNGGGADNNWSTAGNWNAAPSFPTIVTFAGGTRLTNNNDLSAITLNGLTFDPAAGAFVLGGNDITLDGNIGFGANPAAPVTETVNLNMLCNASALIETPTNGTLSLGGNLTSTVDTSLIKIDDGKLTLGGTNTILSWDLNGGTTMITGNTSINGDGGRIYVGDGDYLNDCTGTLVIQPGAVLDITGSFGDTFVIGRDGGSGTVNQNGGAFAFNPGNNGTIWIGATGNTATRSAYNMNGGLLDMSGNTLGIGLGNGVLITGLVNQVSGVISNVYNLWVGWGNGHGVYNLTGGSIYIGANGITTTSGNYAVNLGGGTVWAQTSWSSSLNLNLTGANGPVTFNPAGNNITLSGGLSGSGGLTVAGSGTLELSGANTYSGDTTVNGGTLQLDQTGSGLGAFRLVNGALLTLNFSGNYAIAHLYTNGVALPVGTYNAANLPAFISGPGNLVVSSSISTGLWTGAGANNNWSTSGNWDQNAVPIFPIGLTFAGSNRLVNNNDLSSITASSLTFDAAAGAFTLNGNDITLAGNIGFNGNPSAPVTQTVNLNMALSTSQTIDTPPNGSLILGGNITSANLLTTTDAGTLTLGGVNSIECLSIDGLSGSATIITGNTTINGTGDAFYVGSNEAVAGCHGKLVIQPGAVFTVTGSFGDQCVIGRDGGSGTIVQNGGTFTFNPGSMPNNNLRLLLGATGNSATRAEYDLNGGLLDMSGDNLSVGWGNETGTTGLLDQVSGVLTNVNEIRIPTTGGGSGLGVYTLSGGSVYLLAGGIVNDGTSYQINLGGGTVGAEATWASSLNMNLTGSNGPVTFNPAGYTIALSGALSGSGGLIVTNSGILDLSGANTYTGDTVVSAGSTLELDASWSDPTTLRLANGSMLNLNYTGNYTVLGCYTNGVALPLGTYNASNLGTFLEGSGNLVVAATVSAQTVAYTANFNTTDDQFNNFLNMGHIFNVSGPGIEVFQLGFFDYQNHPLASSHAVTLFNNETAIATVTIPAGPATNLINSFAFEPLSAPIYLPAGTYTVLAYGIDNADPNGEGGNIGINFSANMSVVGACYDWTTLGSPIYPGGPGDNDTDSGPNPNFSLNWDNSTATASFTYANVPAPPVVNHPLISGGNLILTGSGGTAGGGYTWLTSTNLTAPMASWTTNTTGNFDGSGNFSNAVPFSASTPAKFFRLRTP